MEKKLITSFIFCLFIAVLSFNTVAQEYKYDLSKYYTPDIVRNQLDLNFNSNGNFTKQNDGNENSYLYGFLNTTFQAYKNTRKTLSNFTLIANLNGDLTNSRSNSQTILNQKSSSNTYLSLDYTKHRYNSANQFVSFGCYINLGSYVQNSKQDTPSNYSLSTSSSTLDLIFNPSFSIGSGRMERIEDARQAVYILDEFSKKGILKKHLINDEIFNLSQQISRVKNKRFLDSRLHLMDEIAAVDSFFVNNDLIDKSDATYFTTLYDLWQYGAAFNRQSGHVFEISLNPTIDLSIGKQLNKINTITTDSFHTNDHQYGGNFNVSYSYEKPFHLKWQHSASANIQGFTAYTIDNRYFYGSPAESLYRLNFSGLNLNAVYAIGFYPTTRTYFSTNITYKYQLDFSKNLDLSNVFDSTGWFKTKQSNAEFNFFAMYYLSPQLSISGRASLTYLSGFNYNNFSTLNESFSTSLKYSFF